MKIWLFRHGETIYNAEKRYQGRMDIPLSEQGIAQLKSAVAAQGGYWQCTDGRPVPGLEQLQPDVVYTTPLLRTGATAKIVFPKAKQAVIPQLAEMDFGVFEGRNYQEMADDAAYRAWVDGNCEGQCPGGESRDAFSQRVCTAFEVLVEKALAASQKQLVIMAHGGVQMALLAAFGVPQKPYYEWLAPNGGGYLLVLEADMWRQSRRFTVQESLMLRTGNASQSVRDFLGEF